MWCLESSPLKERQQEYCLATTLEVRIELLLQTTSEQAWIAMGKS